MRSSLELIETDTLIAELLARFEHAIFAGMKVQTPDVFDCSQIDEVRRMKGNTRTCQGLAMGHIAWSQANYDQRVVDFGDDQHA